MENENNIQNVHNFIKVVDVLYDNIAEYEKEIRWQLNYIKYVADKYPIIDAEACGFADDV